MLAKNIEDLHADPNINYQTALTERGEPVNSRRMKPNMRRRLGLPRPPRPRRAARRCAVALVEFVASVARLQPGNLRSTGGNGYFYCFAAN